MIEFLETERLLLRPLEKTDAERIFLLDSNPEVMKYIGVNPLTKIEESENVIQYIQKQYKENGIGRYAVIEKASNLLIGWSGVKFLTEELNGYKNVYDLGYRFLPEFWGKGYATESAKIFLNHFFERMNQTIIYAHAHAGNKSSNHTLRKLGFVEVETFVDDLDGAECYWYELTKNKFLNT